MICIKKGIFVYPIKRSAASAVRMQISSLPIDSRFNSTKPHIENELYILPAVFVQLTYDLCEDQRSALKRATQPGEIVRFSLDSKFWDNPTEKTIKYSQNITSVTNYINYVERLA
nr:unnamed protein product [Callosobruchus analis]